MFNRWRRFLYPASARFDLMILYKKSTNRRNSMRRQLGLVRINFTVDGIDELVQGVIVYCAIDSWNVNWQGITPRL